EARPRRALRRVPAPRRIALLTGIEDAVPAQAREGRGGGGGRGRHDQALAVAAALRTVLEARTRGALLDVAAPRWIALFTRIEDAVSARAPRGGGRGRADGRRGRAGRRRLGLGGRG